MAEKIPISVLIPTKNEELNIRQCLESVRWADEIFVVDSDSSDRTKEIAKEYTDKIIKFEWDGELPKKNNWALKNLPFSHDWILVLDADEITPLELKDEIGGILKRQDGRSAYLARFDYHFLGRAIRHGDPVRKIVLFKHRLTEYEKLDDSELDFKCDVEVHEHPITKGKIGVLKTRLIHNDRRGLSAYFDRHNRYSTWEAFLIHKGRYKKIEGRMGLRRLMKYIFLNLPFKPLVYFVYSYVLRLGFLDGYAGLVYNICKTFYAFQIGIKLYEFRAREKRGR